MKAINEFFESLIERSTPAKPIWNKEAILEGNSPKWNYIDGCMAKAILDMYETTKKEEYLRFLDEFIDFYIDEGGTILGYHMEDLNCDNINEGKVLFRLYELTGKTKYKQALDTLYQQITIQPRTESGNFWHKKIYPHQIWLDGLYMVQPFYLTYEAKFNNNKNYKDVFHQFEQVYLLMRDTKTKLLYHGYDETRDCFWSCNESGCSKNFWTRSLGWYTMALVDTLEVLDEQFFYEYEVLQGYLKEVLDALLRFADPATGMFHQVTDQGERPGNCLETSGTCAIAYSLMKGARLQFLPAHYYDYGCRILNSVAQYKLLKEDGVFVLKDICLIAGLGGMPGKGDYKVRDGSYEYYVSEPIVDNDAKGVAPLIFAYSEYLRKEEDKRC
ncbi:glycoside hydrolase family 88/105 protein [Ohessyouella blattaphilus]|uniref:Glycoside hydrolase family 88 protein n=1 Tax=Ohessyouella blattaphilus TaxID=2949333 RepID=A0ABT1EI41_9FIRM|nr:glycoside hydrolase family 88 protein [Ohessyouella blattaphilus]MCP1110369.1 glycoside hydrolase family 88 protein [Ohessyouella blattaphilus]MCR8563763.1 glycoside hydrolase family 88 protein [Ohessyouella blattaphilus]